MAFAKSAMLMTIRVSHCRLVNFAIISLIKFRTLLFVFFSFSHPCEFRAPRCETGLHRNERLRSTRRKIRDEKFSGFTWGARFGRYDYLLVALTANSTYLVCDTYTQYLVQSRPVSSAPRAHVFTTCVAERRCRTTRDALFTFKDFARGSEVEWYVLPRF